jgi:hypothetical protein
MTKELNLSELFAEAMQAAEKGDEKRVDELSNEVIRLTNLYLDENPEEKNERFGLILGQISDQIDLFKKKLRLYGLIPERE